MKKVLRIILLISIFSVVLCSCERRCICKYLDTGSEEVMYSAYSKKECSDWEEYLTNDLKTKASCEYKRFK